jgi:hypothetical protein
MDKVQKNSSMYYDALLSDTLSFHLHIDWCTFQDTLFSSLYVVTVIWRAQSIHVGHVI